MSGLSHKLLAYGTSEERYYNNKVERSLSEKLGSWLIELDDVELALLLRTATGSDGFAYKASIEKRIGSHGNHKYFLSLTRR